MSEFNSKLETLASLHRKKIKRVFIFIGICDNLHSDLKRTTDNQNERFYRVNEEDEVIGWVRRRVAHRSRQIIHRGVWVLVFNDRKELFLQKRSRTKDRDPGLWSISVGGHVTYGQSYEEAATRESKEELGLVAPVTFVKKIMISSPEETEIDAIFTATHNGPFRLNTLEIEAGAFYHLEDIESQVAHQILPMSTYPMLVLKVLYGIFREWPASRTLLRKVF